MAGGGGDIMAGGGGAVTGMQPLNPSSKRLPALHLFAHSPELQFTFQPSKFEIIQTRNHSDKYLQKTLMSDVHPAQFFRRNDDLQCVGAFPCIAEVKSCGVICRYVYCLFVVTYDLLLSFLTLTAVTCNKAHRPPVCRGTCSRICHSFSRPLQGSPRSRCSRCSCRSFRARNCTQAPSTYPSRTCWRRRKAPACTPYDSTHSSLHRCLSVSRSRSSRGYCRSYQTHPCTCSGTCRLRTTSECTAEFHTSCDSHRSCSHPSPHKSRIRVCVGCSLCETSDTSSSSPPRYLCKRINHSYQCLAICILPSLQECITSCTVLASAM
ncbi:hypothetical protein KC19_9G131900 [Ceratodon purpureus]|uniref:Uncharacterized protein n=1 Tax=Ceratodon purpureus TaxID=3225 RepID=A0A8T0GRI6_CERPU|nr:hypothetical protein KC19_9G131900 [Ceratodon purpureus]